MPKQPAQRGPGGKPALGAGVVARACAAAQALFGENFRRARMRAGLTQHDIEAHTGIKQAYVSQIEGGKQNLTLATMAILALAVGKEIRDMLKRLPSPAQRK